MKGELKPHKYHPDGRKIGGIWDHAICVDCETLFPWIDGGYKCNGKWITSCPFCNDVMYSNPYSGEKK